MAGPRLRRRHADHPQAARSTGPTRTARTACCSASARRPRRRSSWPRSPGGTASADCRTAARAGERRSTTTGCRASALKMATGTRQDRRDGDADRLADAQQGVQPRATPASPSGSSSSRPASRSATGCGCCCPSDDENYYDQRDLVPPDLRATLRHGADRRSPTTTRSCRATPRRSRASPRTPASSCAPASEVDPFKETAEQMVARVLRDLGGAGKGEIVVLNDEAHHCYQDKPLEQPDEDADKEAKDAQRARPASGSAACRPIAKHGRHQDDLRPVGDAVLPRGLRLQRGLHLPVGGQRLLADGRHRVGHRQGAAHPGRRRRRRPSSRPTCACGTTSATSCPKKAGKQGGVRRRLGAARRARGRAAEPLPQLRAGASRTGRRSSRRSASRRRCSSSSARTRSSPSWSTTGSPGEEVELRRRTRRSLTARQPAAAVATSTTAAGSTRPRTILVDSAQLESGEALKADFKKAAAARDRGVQGTSTGGATPAPTSTSSPTRTCCAR